MPANLVEGGHRLSRAEYRHFVGIARGSAEEWKYPMRISRDLGYLPLNEYEELSKDVDVVIMMLNGLHRSLSTTKE